MGLGKTVEIIGLMLMNPRCSGIKRKRDELEDEVAIKIETKEICVRCICHNVKKIDSHLISCSICSTEQHRSCVGILDLAGNTSDADTEYVCPFCWKSSKEIIESKTTIIVTPASIKSQWKEELERHIIDKSFKVFIYEGISSGWVSPTELVKFDAILTDFNTLSKELYFSDPIGNSRSRRHKKKFEYPPSPLTSIRFW